MPIPSRPSRKYIETVFGPAPTPAWFQDRRPKTDFRARDVVIDFQGTPPHINSQRILATSPNNLIAYWPQNEQSGLTINCLNNAARNGVYSGPTLNATPGPHGYGAPQYDAINDFGNIYSASIATALANMSAGTLLLFGKVLNSGVWTDGIQRRLVVLQDTSGNNAFGVLKSTSTQLRVHRSSGGTFLGVSNASHGSPTGWFAVALLFSTTNNRLRMYYSREGIAPAQLGSTQTGVTAWSGVTLDSVKCNIGAATQTPTDPFNGYEGDIAIWNTELDFATQLSPLMVL